MLPQQNVDGYVSAAFFDFLPPRIESEPDSVFSRNRRANSGQVGSERPDDVFPQGCRKVDRSVQNATTTFSCEIAVQGRASRFRTPRRRFPANLPDGNQSKSGCSQPAPDGVSLFPAQVSPPDKPFHAEFSRTTILRGVLVGIPLTPESCHVP